MKKEYLLVAVVGMYLLAYLLDAVVDPLKVTLPTPYHFLAPQFLTRFAFSTASIFIRALAIFLTPLFFFSFMDKNFTAKGLTLLILSVLMQLYALQDIATGAQIVPLEWALSISYGGAALLLPMVIYFIKGSLYSMHTKLKSKAHAEALAAKNAAAPEWLSKNPGAPKKSL